MVNDKKQLHLMGTMSVPVFGGADVATIIEVYECLSSHTWTNLVAQDVMVTLPYYGSDMIPDMMKMMSGYVKKDWEQLKGEQWDNFHCTESRISTYTRLRLE